MLLAIPLLLLAICFAQRGDSGRAGTESGTAVDSGSTAWVKKMVEEFRLAPATDPPRRIYRYRWKDATVYYVPGVSPDRYSTLYDSTGQVICRPDGGMTGRGDGTCLEFLRDRRDKELVWEDKR